MVYTVVCLCTCPIGDGQLQQATDNVKARYQRKGLVKSSTEKDPWPPFHAKSFTSLALVHQKIEQLQAKEDTTKAARVRINGEIHKIPELTSSIKLDNIHQIFTPITSDDQCPMSILIEGHPGIGKTTLAKEICLQWANNTLLASDKVVLLLMLRDPNIQKITSIEELVKYTLPSHFIQPVLSYLQITSGTGITFIIDGFDELNNELRHSSFFKELIEGDTLPNARVVVTSRPSASGCLHQHVHRRIEVLGFEKSSKEQYVSKALKGSPDKLQTLTKHFQQYPNIDAICYIPLNMAIIVFLCLLGSLPLTTTEMFASFILHTVCRHLKRTGKIVADKPINIMEDLPQPVQQALQQLEKVAFAALKEDKIIFTVNDLPEMCRDDPTCYGLLQSVQCYCSDEIGITTNSLNFLHLGIQEYFAAKYVATLPDDKVYSLLVESFLITSLEYGMNYDRETSAKQDKVVRLYNMWIFFCGITKGQSSSFKKYLSTNSRHLLPSATPGVIHDKIPIGSAVTISQDIMKDTRKVLYLFQCFQEAQDDTMCDILSKSVDNKQTGRSVIDLMYQPLIPVEVTSLGFFLSRSHKKLDELNLIECHIGDHGINILHQYLCGDKANELKIEEMLLKCNDLTVASSPLISDLITYLQPHKLSLWNNNITRVGDICHAVINTTAVKQLDISENDLTSLEAPAISDMMTCLEELDISHNKLGDNGAVILADGIIKNNTLKLLEIGYNDIRARGAIAIANSLTHNTTMEGLGISGNPISGDGAIAIAEAITNNKTLKTLLLGGDDILDEESVMIIMKSMYNNNSINELYLPKALKDNDNVKSEAENINKTRSNFNMEEVNFYYSNFVSGLLLKGYY